jgi:outer membrane protein TolC
VEGTLSAAATLEDRETILRDAVRENARALDFAQQRYRVGAGDQRAVQQQSLALSSARTALLRVQAERLVQRVNLYLALGGNFEARK